MIAALNGPAPGSEAEYVAQDIRPVLGTLGRYRGMVGARAAARARVAGLAARRYRHEPARACASRARPPRRGTGPPRRHHAGLRDDASRRRRVSEDPRNDLQRARFAAACAALPAAPRSFANSSGSSSAGLRLRPRPPRRRALWHQPDAGRRQSDAQCGAAACPRALGARNRGRGERRLQRDLGRRAAEPHRHGLHRLCRWMAPRPLQRQPRLL